MARTRSLTAAAGFAAAFAVAAALAAAPAPLTARDLDGKTWTPLAPAAGDVNLLLFISADCPVANRYAPEIDRLAATYAPKHVTTFLVYADPTLAPSAARAHVQAFHPKAPVVAITDAGFALTKAVDATVTPEAAIYTSSGRAYRGRIDDRYPQTDQARPEALHHDLRDALDAVTAGHRVSPAETKAVGCFIERKLP